jgi:hypothetical protein
MSDRSPNYPAIPLREAVELVQRFFQAEGKTTVDGETVAKAFGYGSANGTSRTKLGALKQYGLMQGRMDRIAITPLGIRICHPESDDEYLEALREAARNSEVLASLIETHLAASENAVVSHLIKSRSFTPEGARLLARSFKDTVSLAKLDSEAYILAVSRDETGGRKDAGMQTPAPQQQPQRQGPPPSPLPPGAAQRTFTTGTDTMDASITITSHTGTISQEDIEFLKNYLDFLEKGWSRVRRATLDARTFGQGDGSQDES